MITDGSLSYAGFFLKGVWKNTLRARVVNGVNGMGYMGYMGCMGYIRTQVRGARGALRYVTLRCDGFLAEVVAKVSWLKLVAEVAEVVGGDHGTDVEVGLRWLRWLRCVALRGRRRRTRRRAGRAGRDGNGTGRLLPCHAVPCHTAFRVRVRILTLGREGVLRG